MTLKTMDTKRDIKFRAWDKKKKKMEYFSFKKVCTLGYTLTYKKYADKIFMQYTEIEDKNKVEIYKGDIVRVKYYISKIEEPSLMSNPCMDMVSIQNEDEEIPHGEWETYPREEVFEIKSLRQIYCYINDLEKIWEDRKIDSNIFEVIGNKYENKGVVK